MFMIGYCDFQPCTNGNCQATAEGYKCNCYHGYYGRNCQFG